MPLNASIAQGVRPVPIEPQSNALMRALQIVGAQRQNALAEAQMGEQQSAMREREGLRNMLGSPDRKSVV